MDAAPKGPEDQVSDPWGAAAPDPWQLPGKTLSHPVSTGGMIMQPCVV